MHGLPGMKKKVVGFLAFVKNSETNDVCWICCDINLM